MYLRADEQRVGSQLAVGARLQKQNGGLEHAMTDEHNLVPSSWSEGEAYKSSQDAELSLNAAIRGVEIARSYEGVSGYF